MGIMDVWKVNGEYGCMESKDVSGIMIYGVRMYGSRDVWSKYVWSKDV